MCDGDKEMTKTLCNTLSGVFGKTQHKNTHMFVTLSKHELLSYMNEYQDGTWSYSEEKMGDRTYYVAKYVRRYENFESALPWYIQINDEANIRLYDMVEKMKGRLVYRKVDLAVCADGVAIETDDTIGGYKEATLPIKMCGQKRGIMNAIQYAKWNKIYHICDSDKADDIYDIFEKSDGLMICGRAGTGKSYVGRMIAERLGNQCLRIAPTHKAGLNIRGRTIHGALRLVRGRISKKTIKMIEKEYKYVFVDEASMVGRDLLRVLYELKRQTDMKFLIVGDLRQLPPVEKELGRDDYFNTSVMKYLAGGQIVELRERKRYDEELWNVAESIWDGEKYIGQELPDGKYTKKNICYLNDTRKRVNAILNKKYKTEDAVWLNQLMSKDGGEDGEEEGILDDATQPMWLYVGLPVIARRNIGDGEKEMELINNEYYTVKSVGEEVFCACVRVDKNGEEFEHVYAVKLEEFQRYFLMNYCSTVHKSQGETIAEEFTIWDWDMMSEMEDDKEVFGKKLRYTAVTRAKALKNIWFRR